MPFVNLNGHSVHYTDLKPGNVEGLSLNMIFVHGLGSSQNYYYPILPYLTSFRCILFDNYGAGRSSYDGKESSVELIAKDLLGLLDYLEISKAVIVGYSMGGMLPTYLAATASDRIIGGICIGPVHPGEVVAEVFKKRIPVVQKGGVEAMANTIPDGATGPEATPLQKAFIREMIMAQDPGGYIANCKAIENAIPPEYSKVKCPILIIAGETDKSAPLDRCKIIYESLATPESEKKLEVLSGVGHWHCIEASDRVGPLIKTFADQLR